MTVRRHLLQDLVAVIERGGHEVRRLVGREAEHDALVARALILVAAGVHALRDVRRLAVQMIVELQRLPVETFLLVADLPDGIAHRLLDLLKRAGRPLAILVHALAADLAGQHHKLRRRQRLARNARLGVLRQKQIHNRIADLIRYLVRMTLGHTL